VGLRCRRPFNTSVRRLILFAVQQGSRLTANPAARRHQAPTLIGCELLKITSR
jgi:hypothetical protein